MQASDLSRRTGVSPRTLRAYERWGLIPDCLAYDEPRVHRVELIRALLEVGGLTPAEVRSVLGRLDSSDASLHQVLSAVQYALPAVDSCGDDENWARAGERAHTLAKSRGWLVSPDNPAWRTLLQSIVVIEWLGHDDLLDLLGDYAQALEQVAERELRLLLGQPDPDSAATRMVTGTVLGDTVIAALRRLAHEHVATCQGVPAVTG